MSLLQKHCKACEGEVMLLTEEQITNLLSDLPEWHLKQDSICPLIERMIEFKGFSQVMAFVNAVAWVSLRENHHPEITFSYRNVTIRYWTHAIGGLSENDFICAAKVSSLLSE